MFRELLVFVALVAVALGSVVPSFERDPEWGGRIVGGSVAEINQFPYQCSLRTENDAHFCGCSIINNRWVLTAAHCTYGRTLANTRVVVGAHSRTTGGVHHNSSNIYIHGLYNQTTKANDVSLILIQTDIIFNDAVQTIPLASSEVGEGIIAIVSGWGKTSSTGSAAANLMWVSQETVTNAYCRWRQGIYAAYITDSTICAGGVYNEGSCLGDSGGPLVADGVQIGIVSWGIPCGVGVPDVYTRVSSFLEWIIYVVNL